MGPSYRGTGENLSRYWMGEELAGGWDPAAEPRGPRAQAGKPGKGHHGGTSVLKGVQWPGGKGKQ